MKDEAIVTQGISKSEIKDHLRSRLRLRTIYWTALSGDWRRSKTSRSSGQRATRV